MKSSLSLIESLDVMNDKIGVAPDEGKLLYELAMCVPRDQSIVEIGSFRGKSTLYLGAGSKDGAKAPVYAIDLWDKNIPTSFYNRIRKIRGYNLEDTYNDFLRNIELGGVGHLVTPIKDSSENIASKWFSKIGLLFIDGEHTAEASHKDYDLWSGFVLKDGYLAFHDSHLGGVATTINHVSKQHEWTMISRVRSLTVFQRVF